MYDSVCPHLMSMKESEQSLSPTAMAIDSERHRYPYCIVWTPIPLITWLVPVIGHMGICTANGVVRDFAGPYFVSQDEMGFGWPTKYWQLDPQRVTGHEWDEAVKQASDEYMHRMHSLCWDNCHSHVSMALNRMKYNGSENYNMVKTFFLFTMHSRYVSFCALLKSWVPFLVLVALIVVLLVLF